jgi:hypothetical protein
MGWGLPKLNVVSRIQDASHDAQKGIGKLADSGRSVIVDAGRTTRAGVGWVGGGVADVVTTTASETSDAGKFFVGKGVGAAEFITGETVDAAKWTAGGVSGTAQDAGGWLGGQVSTIKWFPIIILAGAGILLYSVRGEVGKTARAYGGR